MNLPVLTSRAGTILISTLSFSISYVALADLAVQSGLGILQSYMWPIVVDGTTVVATAAVVALRNAYAWFLLGCGTVVSLIGNGVHAWTATHSWVAVGVALVPPLALLAVTHLTVQLGRSPDACGKADQHEHPEDSDVADTYQIAARPVATRDIALQLIAEGDMSLRGIGEHLGVSDTTIRRWRDAATETADTPETQPASLVGVHT